MSPQKVERIKLERIEILPLEILVTLALTFGRRLRFSFVESDEIETPMIPVSGWEAASRTDLYAGERGVVGYWAEAFFARRKARAEAALAAKKTPPTSSKAPEKPMTD